MRTSLADNRSDEPRESSEVERHGTPARVHGIAGDITERKRAAASSSVRARSASACSSSTAPTASISSGRRPGRVRQPSGDADAGLRHRAARRPAFPRLPAPRRSRPGVVVLRRRARQAGRGRPRAATGACHQDGEFRHLEAVGVNRSERIGRRRGRPQLPRRHRSHAQAERALAESEERFRAVFESALVGIARADPGGRLVEANRAMQEMLGLSADELRGRLIRDLFHAGGSRSRPARLAATSSKARSITAAPNAASLRRDGQPVWVNLTASMVHEIRHDAALRHRDAREHHRAQAGRGGAAGNQPAPRRLGRRARAAESARSACSARWATCCAPAAASRRPTTSSRRWPASSFRASRAPSA